MSLMRNLGRAYLMQRMLGGGRRRRAGYWGAPRNRGLMFPSRYPRSRRGYFPGPRPRMRSNVRVGGCCLPIPLGLLTGTALAARLLAGRVR